MESSLCDFLHELKEKGSATYRPDTSSLNPQNISVEEIIGSERIFEELTIGGLRKYLIEEHDGELLYDKKSKYLRLDFLVSGEKVSSIFKVKLFKVIEK